jgi:hypothetical protein
MSHFAKINEDNVVVNVLVGDNEMPNEGYDWIVEKFGGTWIKTSYNGNIRKNYAGVGYTYDEQRDAFIAPKPFPSWVLDEETCRWISPVELPNDGLTYSWDEVEQNWQLVNFTPVTE